MPLILLIFIRLLLTSARCRGGKTNRVSHKISSRYRHAELDDGETLNKGTLLIVSVYLCMYVCVACVCVCVCVCVACVCSHTWLTILASKYFYIEPLIIIPL